MTFPVRRPRRLRTNKILRSMVQEFSIRSHDLIYPVFIVEGLIKPAEIKAMPGQMQWSLDTIADFVSKMMEKGVKAFILFGVPAQKTSDGGEAIKNDSVICEAIKRIRQKNPEAYLITDVCLCAYTDHGHCGLLNNKGEVENDVSLKQLAAMALAHAKAGADMVAPSDMMDGRVKEIRKTLDENGFSDIPIMSYSAKYASAFYGPFREAANSAPGKGDRKGYQMDPAVRRDSLIELAADYSEGADILMVKPGLPYLDIVKIAKENFNCPIAVYQVSGEYSMIKAAAEKGWIDERSIVLESLISMKRAGADLILTYFAPEVITWLKGEN
ncbi:MAG: porphobilinogen synthase [Candidatus Rifleibacteriota bacterium]